MLEFAAPCLVDVADGYYQVGFPGPVESFTQPVVVTTSGVIIPTGPETEQVELTIGRGAPSDAASVGTDVVEVTVAEPWEVLTGTAEPASPPTGSILGPGRWGLALRVDRSPTVTRPGGEDMVETMMESHILVVFPLDAAAEAWRPETPTAPERDSLSEVWFVDAKAGAWSLGSDSSPLTFTIDPASPRLQPVQGALSIRFAKRAEITVFGRGRAQSLPAGPQWRLHAQAVLAPGATAVLKRPNGQPAKGLPGGPELTGPAQVSVFLRDPDDEFDEIAGEEGGEPVIVYTRDTPLSDDVLIQVLLD